MVENASGKTGEPSQKRVGDKDGASQSSKANKIQLEEFQPTNEFDQNQLSLAASEK